MQTNYEPDMKALEAKIQLLTSHQLGKFQIQRPRDNFFF
jgi:hypothetical protein